MQATALLQHAHRLFPSVTPLACLSSEMRSVYKYTSELRTCSCHHVTNLGWSPIYLM